MMEVRRELFTFRMSKAEKRMLATLSQRLERTQSDSLRLLIREAAAGLAMETGWPERVERPAGVSDAAGR